MAEQLIVCGKPYRILRLLGHGKGGYSYLAEDDGQQVVVKQIHHEPCDYYAFGNKIEAEQRDYERLQAAGIRIPQMLAIDVDAEHIVKEYIEGPTVFDLVRDGASAEPYLAQVRDMADKAKAAGLNVDWFPTNFVVRDGLIWYVDYECNNYMDEWSFENWGIRYWSRTPEFEGYLKDHKPILTIREERITAEEYIDFLKRTDLGSQYPKERFKERISRLVNTVSISLTARNEQGLLVGVLFGLTDYDEGLCVQCVHIGSYDDEPATVQIMHEYMEAQGYDLDITDQRLHHEIYLSDARKVIPEKLKTVIRHPIKER